VAEPERRPPARPLTPAELVEVLRTDCARLVVELERARRESAAFDKMDE
jgi:hypothetical protein